LLTILLILAEKLESVYKSAPLVGNLCVLANPDFAKPIAVMVPVRVLPVPCITRRSLTLLVVFRQHEANFAKWAKEQGHGSGDLSHLCDDAKVKSAVLAQINATGKAAGLAPMEGLGGLVLTMDEWTVRLFQRFTRIGRQGPFCLSPSH
jgi:long-chain acyl-CoA synthetase